MIQLECDAILFDLDGVLTDSRACVERHWRQWARLHDLDFNMIMRVAHGIRTIETMQIVAPHLSVEEEAQHFTENELQDLQGIVMIEGASELLDSIPIDAWAMVTSGGRALATARLLHTGLPIPNSFVTAEDVTKGKPAPDPFLLAASIMGVSNINCVVVEDTPAGIDAAKSAVMRVIAITTTHDRQDLLKADVVTDRLTNIRVVPNEEDCYRLIVQVE